VSTHAQQHSKPTLELVYRPTPPPAPPQLSGETGDHVFLLAI